MVHQFHSHQLLRRTFLSTSSTVLLDACIATRQATAKPPIKHFQPTSGLYRFSYPQAWALAYDRTQQHSTGAQVLVGNLRDIETLSVVSYSREAYLKSDESDLAVVAAELADEVAQSPASINFEEVGSGGWVGGGRKVEYVVEICRGVVEEGLGGERECKGGNDKLLQTIKRHHLMGVVEGGEDELLVVSASAMESRWNDVGEGVEAAFNSFSLARQPS